MYTFLSLAFIPTVATTTWQTAADEAHEDSDTNNKDGSEDERGHPVHPSTLSILTTLHILGTVTLLGAGGWWCRRPEPASHGPQSAVHGEVTSIIRFRFSISHGWGHDDQQQEHGEGGHVISELYDNCKGKSNTCLLAKVYVMLCFQDLFCLQ